MEDKIAAIEEMSRRVCGRIKNKGREILTEFEITPPQFEALLILIDEGELTTSELSARMFLACSTVTDLLDRMERNGLVQRIKDMKDKRIVRLKVMDKGHVLIDRLLESRRSYLGDVLKDCDEEALVNIEECFKTLYHLMEI